MDGNFEEPKSERQKTLETIEDEIKKTEGRYFSSPFLEKAYENSRDSLYGEWEDPEEVKRFVLDLVGSYRESLEKLYGFKEDCPEDFDKVNVDYSKLQDFESAENLKNFSQEFLEVVEEKDVVKKPEIEEIDVPFYFNDDGTVGWYIAKEK